jgi:hypothetical protein
MTNKVEIIADELGNKIRVSKNDPTYAHVRLQQTRTMFGTNGWVKKSVVSTLLHGKTEELFELKLNDLNELNGKIIIREQLTPFNEQDPERDYKIAGDTGVICCVDGQPIYRKTFFVPDTNAEDELIAHDNGDAIRQANATKTGDSIKKIKQNIVNSNPVTNVFENNESEEESEEEFETEDIVDEFDM